jgi:hypothetical protein
MTKNRDIADFAAILTSADQSVTGGTITTGMLVGTVYGP